jgi:serine phosphatase RsbU (regulator of sigma subunit)
MRLRTRLALAFLLLSVVPLTAITLYSYNSSIGAFRRAVEAEEAAIAADMGKRMEIVTASVSDRFGRISAAAESRDWSTRDRAVDDRFRQQVAATLGEAGDFVSRLQFIPSAPPPPPPPRGRHIPPPHGRSMPPDRRLNPPRPPGGRPSQPAAPPATIEPTRPTPAAPPTAAPARPAVATEPPEPRGQAAGAQARTTTSGGRADARAAGPGRPDAKQVAADAERLIIDLIPSGSIPPEAQATLSDIKDLAAALPQMGQGSAAWGAGLQAAARVVEQGARAVERRIEAERVNGQSRGAEIQRWINRMNEGKGLDIPVRQDGRVVGTMNAEISLERVLGAVLAGRSRESGEIAFAVDTQNRLLVPNRNDRRTLESLGLLDRVRNSREPVQAVSDYNWVLVTRRHPSGILFGIARPIGSALDEIRRTTGRNLGLGMLAILVALVGIVPISSRMTRNLSALHWGVKQIAHGDLSVRVPVRSKDEIGSLSEAFNQMAQDLGAHQKLLAERERLRGELELCRQIQTEMLPKQPLRLGFVEIKGVSIPAREVGGDFFNYFLMPAGEVAVLVGDVSGKGVGAALLMANVQATLRARLALERDLAHLADAIDHEIDESTPKAVYLTLFMGILDSSHHVLRYVNAGHNPQFVLRASGGLARLPSTGLPIAMFAGHGYKEGSVTLGEGDILFFYTDGITEVENEKGEMFGTERLEALVLEHHADGVDALLARIEHEVLTFRGAADLFDDATMMVLRLGASVPTEA